MSTLERLRGLLFSFPGRISRGTFWGASIAVGSAFVASLLILESALGRRSSLVLYPPFLWAMAALLAKRMRDRGRSPAWLLASLLPVIGPLWLLFELGVRKGTPGENHYGPDPLEGGDYLAVAAVTGSAGDAGASVVDDVTALNPIAVGGIATPTSTEEVQEAIRRSAGPISVGGGHFSMGGQTASPGSLHLDMRRMNRIVELSPLRKTIRVEAGVRWCDIQKFIDPHGLSVKIMQSYANFTVGGSLSVNAHGRYVGLGPLILSVRAVRLVLTSGEVVEARPDHNRALFYGVLGGYSGLVIIVEDEL